MVCSHSFIRHRIEITADCVTTSQRSISAAHPLDTLRHWQLNNCLLYCDDDLNDTSVASFGRFREGWIKARRAIFLFNIPVDIDQLFLSFGYIPIEQNLVSTAKTSTRLNTRMLWRLTISNTIIRQYPDRVIIPQSVKQFTGPESVVSGVTDETGS